MSTKPLKNPHLNEHILRVEPSPQPFIEAGWRSRPNLYTGRPLSAATLSAQQRERSGWLALHGQRVSPGVVAGLEVQLVEAESTRNRQEPTSFLIGPGTGLLPSGEDVIVPRALKISVDRIPVYWEGSLGPAGFNLGILGSVDATTTHAGLRAAVLVLVPVVSRKNDPPDPYDPGHVDPEVRPLDDERLVDGCTLVLFAWPKTWELPPRDSASDQETWRNRLAWELFDREQQRQPGWLIQSEQQPEQYAPWEKVGVPLALVGFDPPNRYGGPARPLFVDRAAVVRAGGAPRTRTPLLDARGTPLLWQARAQQFAEHLASFTTEELTDGTALRAFERLPPVGVLPKHAINLFDWSRRFFPNGFKLEAVPMPLEQLDAVAQASAPLSSLHTSEREHVRVLVPVPDVHFDPHLLRQELLDPSFQSAITASLRRLAEWLKRREDVRLRATALRKALEGDEKPLQYPAQDPAAIPGEYVSPEASNPPEEDYETRSSDSAPPKAELKVPALQEALARNGTWAEPQKLGQEVHEVFTATSLGADKFAVVTRLNTALTVRYYSEDKGVFQQQYQDVVTDSGSSYLECRPVWSGNKLLLVLLKGDSSLHLNIGRRTSDAATGTWDWRLELSHTDLTPSSITHFTAVSWADNCVDAFVATQDTILQFTWILDPNGDKAKTQTHIQRLLPTTSVGSRRVSQMVALCPEKGRIELFFLGQQPPPSPPSAPLTRPSWLHHLSGFHSGDKPELNASTLQVVEEKSLMGHHLAACVSRSGTSKRFDVLVMGDDINHKGIRHGWKDESWKFGVELVSPRGGQVIHLVPGSGEQRQLHAFWLNPTSSNSQGYAPLQYRRFENNHWKPIETLPQQKLHTRASRGAFSVFLPPSNQVELFLASYSGLLNLKKVPESTQLTVQNKGLRGLIHEVEALHQETITFTQKGSTQLQNAILRVRQLMQTSSTDASRQAVYGRLGSNLMDARNGIENYFTGFYPYTRVRLIRLSDALETLQQATALRRDLTARLIEQVRRIVPVKQVGLDVAGMYLLGIATTDNARTQKAMLYQRPAFWGLRRDTKFVVRTSYLLSDVVNNPLTSQNVLRWLGDEPENIRRALTFSRVRWVESDYFSTALQHLENMLALLKDLERRMNLRWNAMEDYKQTLRKLEGSWGALDKRMRVVDDEIAEARQDVTVGRALLLEEEGRINAVNQRRRKVFEQHVPFLVFQRPRERELTLDAPSRMLDPGVITDLLPKVFASTSAAPPELLSYTELIRDSPLKWFTVAPELLGGLDRLEFIHRTFVRAQARALHRIPIKLPAHSGRVLTSHAQGLYRVLSSQEDLIARSRYAFVQYYQPAILETRTWLELQQSAREYLSLGDLIDMSHGRPDVGRNAAAELDHISKVATGLYQRFGEVLPSLRLEWAERMSQYDAPVDLHDLSRLPHWDQLEGTDRRELQTLVNWLFARVVSTQPEAASLMNDLVRVCMLLASHAPVNELLSGHLSKPTVARVGGTLELAVDPSRVRIGMNVMIRSGEQTVEAVVEDLSTGVVKARVLSASPSTVHLPEKASARFADPARGVSFSSTRGNPW
ncbi:MAG TPA: hypothetical protein VEU33_27955 [Archangium sp.]|nr:hypothetical protein [Archangium sp.]